MAKKKMANQGAQGVKKVFRNRIVGSGEESPEKLLANPKNWRVHSWEQERAVEGMLDELGWLQTVIVNKTTGHLVDGHLRLELAKKRGERKIPVVYVKLTPAEEDLALALLDPLGDLATKDEKRLEKLLQELDPGDAELQALLAKMEDEIGVAIDQGGAGSEETLLDQAVQLEPGKEFIVVMCDDDDDFTRLKTALDLGTVRRGGYKAGSAFDATGIERVVKASRLLKFLGGRRKC
jgi:hypothetical protein